MGENRDQPANLSNRYKSVLPVAFTWLDDIALNSGADESRYLNFKGEQKFIKTRSPVKYDRASL